MKKVIVYIWNDTHVPYGVFTSQKEADKQLLSTAKNINYTLDQLKLDLYIYTCPVNELY